VTNQTRIDLMLLFPHHFELLYSYIACVAMKRSAKKKKKKKMLSSFTYLKVILNLYYFFSF